MLALSHCIQCIYTGIKLGKKIVRSAVERGKGSLSACNLMTFVVEEKRRRHCSQNWACREPPSNYIPTVSVLLLNLTIRNTF